jgi:type VI secretion system protein VasJ
MSESELSRCLAPVSAEHPVGAEVRQLPGYQALRAEIDKLDDPRGIAPDWGIVEVRGAALLCERGKDLLVACYVAWARYERLGPAGLAEGVALVSGLLAMYRGQLYPPRDRARVHALSWLLGRLETLGVLSDGMSAVAALPPALERLQTIADEVFGDRAPSFEPLVRQLRVAPGLREAERVATPISAPDMGTESIAAVPQRGSADAPPAVPQPDDGDLTLRLGTPVQRRLCLVRTGHLLRALAARCLEDDLADPRAYRLLRVAGSLQWDELPVANERGRTELDPPSARRLRELDKARKTGAFRDVVGLSENLLAQQPLWLDGHWITAQALTALGGAYDVARAVVTREGRGLLARLPGLVRLTFADGSAFGSAEACAWLSASDDPVRRTPADASTSDQSIPAEASVHALIARVVANDADARSAFERAVRASRSARRAFQLRLLLAQKLEAVGHTASAARVYAGLERDLDAYRIDLWEPDLARAVVLGLFRTLPALAARGGSPHELARVGARAAQLAPITCL